MLLRVDVKATRTGGGGSHIHRLTDLSRLLLRTGATNQRQTFLRWLWAAEGASIVIKETAESELIEGMFRFAQLALGGAQCVAPATAPGFWPIPLHRVKVGGIHGVADPRPIGCRLCAQVAGEVNLAEEGVGLDLSSAVTAEPVLG